MGNNEVIVKVLATPGSLTLYGIRIKKGWLFSRDVIDQSPELLDDPWVRHSSEIVNSWPDALALLDKYPWHDLCPRKVHPEFCELILDAVVERLNVTNNNSLDRLPDWEKLCGVSED